MQTFDSLPDPGSASVNSFNNPQYVGNIGANVYSLANPFDFAYPVINTSFVGGLGLSNTMSGWYGAADTLYPGVGGFTRFGAQDGDQSTGGDIDFGPLDGNGILGTNRALGLLSTSTTGSTTFALKLINSSPNTLNYISLGFVGELWRQGTGARDMSFGYTLDNTASSFSLSAQSISNSTQVPALAFSFPAGDFTTNVDGTAAENQHSARRHQSAGGRLASRAARCGWFGRSTSTAAAAATAMPLTTSTSTPPPTRSHLPPIRSL